MSNRPVSEQICGVLILELGISRKEAERFLDFYRSSDRRFDFTEGTPKGGWFLKGHAVGAEPLLRKKHQDLIKKVNGVIFEILEKDRRGAQAIQVA